MKKNINSNQSVPSLRTIQEILVNLEDKESTFIDSKDWIGSIEVEIKFLYLYKIIPYIRVLIHMINFAGLLGIG